MEEQTSKTVERFKKAVKKCYDNKVAVQISNMKANDLTFLGKDKKYTREEKRRAKGDIALLNYFESGDHTIEGMPIIPLLMCIESTELLKNVILDMISLEMEEERGVENE